MWSKHSWTCGWSAQIEKLDLLTNSRMLPNWSLWPVLIWGTLDGIMGVAEVRRDLLRTTPLMNSCSVDHHSEKRMESVGTCGEDMSMSSCVVLEWCCKTQVTTRSYIHLGRVYRPTWCDSPVKWDNWQLSPVNLQKWHQQPINIYGRHRQAIYVKIWQWLLVNVNRSDDSSKGSNLIKETAMKHLSKINKQSYYSISTMTTSNITPLSCPKMEFEDSHLCSHEVNSTLNGWGIHECPGKLDSQGRPSPVQSAPKKLLTNTPDIWTPSLPWYSPVKVKELNSKIKEQDTIFEMEKIPQKQIKVEKHKINLYEQVPFIVSIHYSNKY